MTTPPRTPTTVLGVALAIAAIGGCATNVPIEHVGDLVGEWQGRISSPAGNAPATMTGTGTGAYNGTMSLDQGAKPFRGAFVVVRPGYVSYQGTDGNGTARLSRDEGRTILKFLRDDGGVDARFSRAE